MQAFEEGGGGKRAAALRALADAQLAAKGAKGAKAAPNGKVDSAAAERSGPDPRLQPPERSDSGPVFKPGAATWNTDDPKQVWLNVVCGRWLELLQSVREGWTRLLACSVYCQCEKVYAVVHIHISVHYSTLARPSPIALAKECSGTTWHITLSSQASQSCANHPLLHPCQMSTSDRGVQMKGLPLDAQEMPLLSHKLWDDVEFLSVLHGYKPACMHRPLHG